MKSTRAGMPRCASPGRRARRGRRADRVRRRSCSRLGAPGTAVAAPRYVRTRTRQRRSKPRSAPSAARSFSAASAAIVRAAEQQLRRDCADRREEHVPVSVPEVALGSRISIQCSHSSTQGRPTVGRDSGSLLIDHCINIVTSRAKKGGAQNDGCTPAGAAESGEFAPVTTGDAAKARSAYRAGHWRADALRSSTPLHPG